MTLSMVLPPWSVSIVRDRTTNEPPGLRFRVDPKKVGERCGSSTLLRTGIGTVTFASWVLIGLIGGWVAHNAAEYSNGLLSLSVIRLFWTVERLS
jgi:hypothetical protein